MYNSLYNVSTLRHHPELITSVPTQMKRLIANQRLAAPLMGYTENQCQNHQKHLRAFPFSIVKAKISLL